MQPDYSHTTLLVTIKENWFNVVTIQCFDPSSSHLMIALILTEQLLPDTHYLTTYNLVKNETITH